MSENAEKNAHAGHRFRLTEKLDSGTLCEHEYLEILLFNVVPRQNTNGLAHRLLAEFGSMPGIFSAKFKELCRVEGVGRNVAAYLVCIGAFFRNYAAPKTQTFPKIFEEESFCAYIKKAYENVPYEVLDIYLLDGESRIYRRKQFSTEALFSVSLDSEKFSQLLGEENPSGIVLVHTHPKGDIYPSEMYDQTTEKIQLYCSMHNLLFCDHFIYSPQGIYSYQLTERLEEIRQRICVDKIVRKGSGI